jgi:Uma2 family endonuclease
MESYVHVMQIVLLLSGLRWHWRDRSDYFATANMSIFYTVMTAEGNKVLRKVKFRGPDFFVALGVRREPKRRSWVVANEGKYPDVIVEVLSDSTKKSDRSQKKDIYEQIFGTQEYFLFDPKTQSLEGFRLVGGKYVPIPPNTHGHLWSEKLGMALGLHYHPEFDSKVARYFDANGEMILVPDEEALKAQRVARGATQEAAKAKARARLAETKAARLAEKLRSLGVDPDKLS